MNTPIDITNVILTSPRLTLRPWRETDLEDFYEYARVDGVGHFDWNRQSQRVIEKCGFHYIKTLPCETRYETVETSEEYILYREERNALEAVWETASEKRATE